MKKTNMQIQEFQKGENSKLTPMERVRLHNEWLKNIHNELKEHFNEKKEVIEEYIPGGFDD